MRRSIPIVGLLIGTIGFGLPRMQSAESRFSEPIQPDGIRGTLVLVGGGEIPDSVPLLLKESQNNQPIVILAGASENPQASAESATAWLAEHGITNAISISSALPKSEQVQATMQALEQCNAVWIPGGQQSLLADSFVGSNVAAALQKLLERGGVVAGTSAGAAIMSKVMIASGQEQPQIAVGWDLLPDAVIDQHFTERNRLVRLQAAINDHPNCFGLGIDEATALIVTERTLKVVGQGGASVVLAKASYRDAEVQLLSAGDTVDLTQLRRAARQRSFGVDPGETTLGIPKVRHGSLMIVGGGTMPPEIVERFLTLAGGRKAKIVVLPTGVPRSETSREVPRFLKADRVESVVVLDQRGAEVATEEFRTAIQEATGVWFGGGRQWNFVDAYEETPALELFRDVLRRGGVIGGSSAGATIQGEFLVRGPPLGNTVMMAEGYERGFGFLPGVAIDQHFTQRSRQRDLLTVIQRHPKLLGIGIDEGTAIVVTGSVAEVIGLHAVHFVSARNLNALSAGQSVPSNCEEAAKFYKSIVSGESLDLTTLQ